MDARTGKYAITEGAFARLGSRTAPILCPHKILIKIFDELLDDRVIDDACPPRKEACGGGKRHRSVITSSQRRFQPPGCKVHRSSFLGLCNHLEIFIGIVVVRNQVEDIRKLLFRFWIQGIPIILWTIPEVDYCLA